MLSREDQGISIWLNLFLGELVILTSSQIQIECSEVFHWKFPSSKTKKYKIVLAKIFVEENFPKKGVFDEIDFRRKISVPKGYSLRKDIIHLLNDPEIIGFLTIFPGTKCAVRLWRWAPEETPRFVLIHNILKAIAKNTFSPQSPPLKPKSWLPVRRQVAK